MYNKSFSVNPRKINIHNKSARHSLLKDISYFRSFHKNKKKELKLPNLKKSFNSYNKTKTRSKTFYHDHKGNKKLSYKYSKLFPTSTNEIFHRNNNNIKTNKTNSKTFGSLTDSNLNALEQSKMNLPKNEDTSNINIKQTKKFRQYKKFFETSSLINNQGINISNDIKNNPFMRKIEDLNKINQFEIIFHNNIMQNIKSVYGKTKKGFFRIEHITKSKDAIGTGYICENDNNIFSVSDMIERMNPISTLKFSNLLRKDYKEFLGYENKKKKNRIKEDLLRQRVIKKYNRELFFENEFADKYNIKKNSGVKFIFYNNEDDNKQKKKDDDYYINHNTYY